MSAPRSVLSLRPVTVVNRLPPRSQACVLSLRDLLGALPGPRRPLPVVVAPHPSLMRAALLAAKEARSALGLALSPGLEPERWFLAAAEAADQLAPNLPVFLSGELVVSGAGGVEAAVGAAHRLVEAGLTHLAVDAAAVAASDRARVVAEVGAFAREREIALDCPFPDEVTGPEEGLAFLEELRSWGLEPDLLSVRLPAPVSGADADHQAAALRELAAAVAPVPLLRRGPCPTSRAAPLAGAGLAAAEDGGQIRDTALAGMPAEAREALVGAFLRGTRPAMLGPALAERFEGLAFADAAGFIEALGAGGSASAVLAVLAGPGPR